jgi:hypothetical protein
VIREMDFVVKSEALEVRTFWIAGWEGWIQSGLRGAAMFDVDS